MSKDRKQMNKLVGAVMAGIGQKKKKTPSMLFSWGRSESWSSDDSNDSDFQPSGDENQPGPSRRSRRTAKRPTKTRNKKGASKDSFIVSDEEESSSSSDSEEEGRSNNNIKKKSSPPTRKKSTRKRRVKVEDSDDDGMPAKKMSKSAGKKKTTRKRKRKASFIATDSGSESSYLTCDDEISKKKQKEKAEAKKRTAVMPAPWKGDGNTLFPPEVWVRIFRFSCGDDVASFPQLLKLSHVCRQFRQIVHTDKSVWSSLAIGAGKLKQTPDVLNRAVQMANSRTAELKLGGWKKLSENDLKNFLTAAPNLRSLAVPLCQNLVLNPQSAVKLGSDLGGGLSNLTTLDCSATFVRPSSVFSQFLQTFLTLHATQLQRLFLNENFISNILKIIQSADQWLCRSTLKVLDISAVKCHRADFAVKLKAFAKALPALRTLHLRDSPVVFGEEHSYDAKDTIFWPDLEDLNIAYENKACRVLHSPCHDYIGWIAKNCHALKQLNISGHNQALLFFAEAERQPELTHLWASKCGAFDIKLLDNNQMLDLDRLKSCLEKTVVIDLSWMKGEISLETILCEGNGKMAGFLANVESLNLSGTALDTKHLKLLLKACPKLSSLNTSSCRSLKPGMKRCFDSREEVLALSKKKFDYD